MRGIPIVKDCYPDRLLEIADQGSVVELGPALEGELPRVARREPEVGRARGADGDERAPSLRAVTTYLPSGEMAARTTSPSLVNRRKRTSTNGASAGRRPSRLKKRK